MQFASGVGPCHALQEVEELGQNILGRAADKRADMTYQDAEAIFHEANHIQAHLKAQDDALGVLLDKGPGSRRRLKADRRRSSVGDVDHDAGSYRRPANAPSVGSRATRSGRAQWRTRT